MTGLNTSKNMPPEQMFRTRYIVDTKTDCWIWQGSGDKNGYGSFQPRGERWRAHRYSWFLTNGPIPNGLFVCHSCDNPSCVNPDHLFLGTNADNLNDMVNKGRSMSGESNPSVKLTEADINPIRNDPRPYVEIGNEYGISAQNVCLIKQRKTWIKVREVLDD